MTGTVLVKEAVWRISTLLQNIDPQFNAHPEGDIVRFIDDAQMALATFLPLSASRIDAILARAGTRQSIATVPQTSCKPGDGSTPTADLQGLLFMEAFGNMGADGLTPGTPIRPVPRDVLDTSAPNWRSNTKAVPYGYVFDPRFPLEFYLVPGLKAPAWIEIGWTAVPPKIVNTGAVGAERYAINGSANDRLSVRDEYLDPVVNYVVARCNMKPVEWADGNKAQTFAAAFLSFLNTKIQVATGTNPNLKVLPFAPEPLARAK